MNPTEDTPTLQGGLAHAEALKAHNNQVDTLNPGSDAAIALGCSCPVLDNGHGKRNDGLFWVTAGCPIHHGGGNDLAKNSPETTSADTQIRPGEHKKQELEGKTK